MVDREQTRRDAERDAKSDRPFGGNGWAQRWLELDDELAQAERKLQTALDFMEHHQDRADAAEALIFGGTE